MHKPNPQLKAMVSVVSMVSVVVMVSVMMMVIALCKLFLENFLLGGAICRLGHKMPPVSKPIDNLQQGGKYDFSWVQANDQTEKHPQFLQI